MSKHESSRAQSRRIALCGMMAALSVALMLSGGLIPVMTYVSPLVSGVLLLPVLLEFGRKYAWTTWLAAALIVLLLGADKEAAFFYLFLGYYPIAKWDIDRRVRKRLRPAVKAALFLVASGAMYAVMALLMGVGAVLADFTEMGYAMTAVFFVLLTVCMLMYDWLLLPLTLLYTQRLRPRLRLLRH